MYGARFVRVRDWPEFRGSVSEALGAARTTVIEVPVDRTRNVALHREIWAEVGSALEERTSPNGAWR
jgi:2-succinyl-5-enolpyruvyl-6-hydroxy-3-cyclohexene-1-carboxylate synthase